MLLSHEAFWESYVGGGKCVRKIFCRIVTVNEMQVGFMHEKGIIDVFILRRLQDEYCANGKSCIYFVDLEKSFDGLPQKVLQWVIRKKGISEVLVRLTINLYEGAKTRIGVDFELSEVEVGMHQGFVLSPFPFVQLW